MNKQGIAIFGGTFNPFHKGHESIVAELSKMPHISEIWLLPTGITPHKAAPTDDDLKHRLAMLEIAAEHCSATYGCTLKVRKDELDSSDTSYTVDSLSKMIDAGEFDKKDPYFVMGLDSLLTLHTWKKPKVLLKLAKLIVFQRHHASITNPSDYIKTHFPKLADRIELVKNDLVQVSSTEIRSKLVDPSVNAAVIQMGMIDDMLSYIDQNKLQNWFKT